MRWIIPWSSLERWLFQRLVFSASNCSTWNVWALPDLEFRFIFLSFSKLKFERFIKTRSNFHWLNFSSYEFFLRGKSFGKEIFRNEACRRKRKRLNISPRGCEEGEKEYRRGQIRVNESRQNVFVLEFEAIKARKGLLEMVVFEITDQRHYNSTGWV